MRAEPQTKAKSAAPSLSSSRGALLQRKCACGSSPGADGERAECRKNRLELRRKVDGSQAGGMAPGIVHEVLRSQGEPLDSAAREFMEPRFGHNFGNVRIHSDSRAAESARAVGATAYAVGNHIVFGRERYSPRRSEGARLLAHELAHVVQQQGSGGYRREVPIASASDAAEIEADKASARVLSPAGAELPHSSTPLQTVVSLRRKCEVATPKDCTDYQSWLSTFPASTATGDADITSSMPKDLQDLITGGGKGVTPDCADVAIILRHYYMKTKQESTSFLVGAKKETATTFSIGAGVADKELKACLIGAGTLSFQETRTGFKLVNFYREKGKNITNLKGLIDAGLKPGDAMVWKRNVEGTGYDGHAQTVQAVTAPKFDTKDPTKLISGGSLVVVQGNMSEGVGVGQLQQRQKSFMDLTGNDDGNAPINDVPGEAFFGAGPWKK